MTNKNNKLFGSDVFQDDTTYLEDHPRRCKWLGSPLFTKHLGHRDPFFCLKPPKLSPRPSGQMSFHGRQLGKKSFGQPPQTETKMRGGVQKHTPRESYRTYVYRCSSIDICIYIYIINKRYLKNI